ncbi:hypothetical protein BB560_007067 [Smittium megazygosporum]|nr:hypothetical protein BB560_007067 [Smittium megazygosporum]
MPDVKPPESYPEKLSAKGVRNIFNFDEKDLTVSKEGEIQAECRFIGNPISGASHKDINDHELPPYVLWWYKAKGDLSNVSNFLHQCAVAYHSDYQLVFTSLLPHKVGSKQESEILPAMVSLDHCVWFHGPVRGDEWLLYEMQSHRASCNRALITGKLYNTDGDLVVSVVQEGFIKQAQTMIPHDQPKYIAYYPPRLSTKLR